jgi:hypothetical protein
MFTRLTARLHVALVLTAGLLADRLRAGPQRGQATVEYVALILLVAGVLAAAVTVAGRGGFDLGATVSSKLKSAIDGVAGQSKIAK